VAVVGTSRCVLLALLICITQLGLEVNGIGDVGAVYHAKAVEANSTLTEVCDARLCSTPSRHSTTRHGCV